MNGAAEVLVAGELVVEVVELDAHLQVLHPSGGGPPEHRRRGSAVPERGLELQAGGAARPERLVQLDVDREQALADRVEAAGPAAPEHPDGGGVGVEHVRVAVHRLDGPDHLPGAM